MSSENRREARQRVLLKGRITFNYGASSFDCLVRDMSTSGARLCLSQSMTLPEVFDLYVPQKDRTYRATMRWRREDGVGVAFDEGLRAPPAPAADASTELPMVALLRRVSELEAENAALRRLLAGTASPTAPASAA